MLFSFVFVDKVLSRGRVLSVGAVFMTSRGGQPKPVIFEVSSMDIEEVYMELRRFIVYHSSDGSRSEKTFVVNASGESLAQISDRLGLRAPAELPIPKTQLARMGRTEYQEAVFSDCLEPRSVSVAAATFDKHPLGRTALVILLERSMETNVALPTVFDSTGKLILEGDALQQLHIDDLIKTIDYTRTAAGGRMLAERLRNPHANEERIREALAELRSALEDPQLATCGPILKGILDIERIAKTMARGEQEPDAKRAKSFVASAIKTFEKVNELYAHFGGDSPLLALPARLESGEDLEALATDYAEHFTGATEFVATTDFFLALSELIRDGYVIPELYDVPFVKGLRYPVAEAALGREPFIANDVDGSSKVLYSYNGTGKSTYMRAFGSAMVLAQAGFPVPAEHMRFKPLLKIFTRLSHRDMVGRGLSTFEVDALELSHIVSRADARTLVLTEDVVSSDSLSNATISANFIRELLARDAVVVAATHCTEIALMFEDICWHFPVRFAAPDTGAFVFERTLTRGLPPARAYGLEMASALGVDAQLLVRPQTLKKASRYNAKLVVDHCAVCGDKATQTHHIRPQKDFAADRGSREKNHLSNLAPLCDRCHDSVHHGSLRIEGYRKTSRGVKLVFHNEPDDILADLSLEPETPPSTLSLEEPPELL